MSEPAAAEEFFQFTEEIEPKYGLDADGNYRTPYEITVVHGDDLLGNVVAGVCKQCQSIPVIEGADLSKLGEISAHPSPTLTILTPVSVEAVDSCIARGFQTIRIMEGCVENVGERPVIVFKRADIYDNILPESGLGPVMAIEHAMGATFPDYAICGGISREDCAMFARGLRGKPVLPLMREMTDSLCGHDQIEYLVAAGRASLEYEDVIAANLMNRGYLKEAAGRKFYVVQGSEHIDGVKRVRDSCELFAKSGAEFIAFVDLAAPATWSLTLLSRGELSAVDVLSDIVGEEAAGGSTQAHAVCGTPIALKLI